MNVNDGGPAFPIWTPDMPVEGSPGLSIRDWFAGQALAAVPWNAVHETLRINQGIESPTVGDVAATRASIAYAHADAMLAARTPAEPEAPNG